MYRRKFSHRSFSMATNRMEEIEFLFSLQRFTINCVANQSPLKIESYCHRLLLSVQNLPKIYIGHKIEIALALESAAQRNENRFLLNKSMNIISHLIYLCRPNFASNEDEISKQWANIDLHQLLDSCENRFKQQTYSTTLWCRILNENSLVSVKNDYFENCSFDFVQHDAEIEQVFQWINGNHLEIPGRFNRTYGGIPLFWCAPFHPLQSESKYGSIRLIFPFSTVYSSTQHHLFDLRTRKNGSEIWKNILITQRQQIAGYGTDFHPVSSISSSPVDIAVDLTDGPLIPSHVRITFVNHLHQCVPLLPEKLTPQHPCYHTSNSARIAFLRYLRQNGQLTLNQLKHFFDSQIFEELTQIDDNIEEGQRS